MNFSESYFIENYEKALEAALRAKNAGNYSLASERFAESAKFLAGLAAVGDASKREERKVRAERLKAIAETMRRAAPPKSAGAPLRDVPGGYGGEYSAHAGGGYSGSVYSGSGYSGGAEIYDGIESYVTLIEPQDLGSGFEGVMGMEEAKEAITEYVINPVKYPEAYSYDFIDNKAILLYGPPGTGKTTFAKAVAKEVNEPFFLVNMAGLVNCYVGETAKNIDKIFDYIRDYTERNRRDVIVFFDEMDEIAKKRGGDDKASESAVPALLRNLDGVKKNKGFLVLANTNYAELLDEAILSRFRRRVYIPLPDKDTRVKLLRLQLKDLEPERVAEIDFDGFGDESEGLSGRDIAYLADDFKRSVAAFKAGIAKDLDYNKELTRLIKLKRNGGDR